MMVLTLPKREESKPRSVKIKVENNRARSFPHQKLGNEWPREFSRGFRFHPASPVGLRCGEPAHPILDARSWILDPRSPTP